MNSRDEKVSVQAFGNWFQFGPGQIKNVHNTNLAMFLAQNRGEDGLVDIPDEVMEMDKSSTEFKEIIEDKRKEGVNKRIQKLNSIVNNLEASLRYDVETKGLKVDPLSLASKGELNAYKELASYKDHEAREALNVADEIRKLKGQISGNGTSNS
jgi:hypothetical protein